MTSRTSGDVVTRQGADAPGESEDGPSTPASPRRWLIAAPPVGLLVMLLALLRTGGAPEPFATGLPDPGVLTRWGLPVSRLIFDVSAVVVIGGLVTALLLPAADYRAGARRALRYAGWGAWAWALAALLLVLLTVSDVLGVPPADVFASDRVSEYAWQLAQGRGLLVAAGCAVLVGAYSRWTDGRTGVAVLLALAVGGLLPVLFSGHSAASANHDLATSSLVLHVVAASVWVGGLAGVLLLRRSPQVLAVVLPRYSAVALVCFLAVAGSGVLNAWIRTSGDLALWATSAYGALLAVKISALAGLGVVGWWHRRRTVDAVRAEQPRAFARLATIEVLLMAATVGVAVALSRTPPPAGATLDVPSHGTGHPTLGDDVAPFTLVRLFTEWRPEAVSLAVVALAFGCYLAGLRRLRLAGIPWPRSRVVAATGATVVALLATSGGVATYSTATFSAQVTQFLVLFVVVPALVALSAPVTMVLRVTGAAGTPSDAPAAESADALAGRLPSGPLSWLADPLNMLIVATVMLFSLYATPLLEASLRSAPLHLFVNLFTLAVGCLFWWSVLAVDPVPQARPRTYRLWVLLGFLLLLGGIGARIYLSDVLLAGAWFSDLDWSWVEMPADQRRGAALMWIGALTLGPLLALLTAVRRTAGR